MGAEEKKDLEKLKKVAKLLEEILESGYLENGTSILTHVELALIEVSDALDLVEK